MSKKIKTPKTKQAAPVTGDVTAFLYEMRWRRWLLLQHLLAHSQ